MKPSWIYDNWARESELKNQCTDCVHRSKDGDWFACDHEQREFPKAAKCHWYLPAELDE